jgi:L,D-transpeptidase ErfK/SrfK
MRAAVACTLSMLVGAGVALAACEPPVAGLALAGVAPERPGAGLAAPGAVRGPAELVEFAVDHRVVAGESLTSLGARYGIALHLIAEANGLDARAHLRIGQTLVVRSRHLAPQAPEAGDGIVINLPQRMAFLVRGDRVERAYPVAVGRPNWPTPIGPFTVRTRERDKTWYVPVSIQEEMRREGKPVQTQVPPGPDNPLGRHWIGLSMPAIGIHGTNAPASVYGFRSHGCLRMHPDDVADLFDRVAIGERGRIVYEPLLMGRDDDGRIWFEANPDAYRRGAASVATVRAMARERGIGADSIDWAQVVVMLSERDGQAREVGLGTTGGNR